MQSFPPALTDVHEFELSIYVQSVTVTQAYPLVEHAFLSYI